MIVALVRAVMSLCEGAKKRDRVDSELSSAYISLLYTAQEKVNKMEVGF